MSMNSENIQPVSKTPAKRALYSLMLILGVLFLLLILVTMGLLIVETMPANQVNRINESIRLFGFWSQFFRWAFYLLLFIYWQHIIGFWGRVRQWDNTVIKRAKASRLSSIIILIAVELFLIQSIHISLYAYLVR